MVERVGPWGFLQGGREGEDDEEEAHSEAKRAAPLRGAGGLRAGGHGAGVDEPRRFGGRRERGGSGGDRRPGDPALAVKRGRIQRLDIAELEVGRLHVRELVVEQEQRPVLEHG